MAKKEAEALGISVAEFVRGAIRRAFPLTTRPVWMRYAGLVESGNPRSSQSVDDVMYGFKVLLVAIAALLLSAGVASAATAQKWTPGWDNFHEPLNYQKSKLTWSVNPSKRTLTVTYTLVSATPNKLYQAGIHIFCETFPKTFGQFPTDTGGGSCPTYTRQGVTKSAAGLFVGVVTTDIHGDGSFSVVVGPIASGAYDVEFWARDGAGGCDGNQGSDFQSPGPKWGDATTITIPESDDSYGTESSAT